MKLGARILKTGIAVALSIYLANFLGMDPVIFAAIAAVLTIQPSLYRSWQNIIEQVQANIIGAILAVTFTYLLGVDPFVVGLVVMIVIAINLQLGFERSIPLSIVTVIAIMESAGGDFLGVAFNRFLLIMMGMGASVLVNAIFLPPRYEDKLYSRIQETNRNILDYLRTSVGNEVEGKHFREDVKQFKLDLLNIDQLYSFYREERTYFRKVKYSKTRKLVVFRNMIQTTQSALLLLKHLEREQSNLQIIPENLRQLLQREMEILTNYHEKVLLKFEGRIKIQHPHQTPLDVFQGREVLLKNFMALYTENTESTENKENNETRNDYWIHLFPLFSKVIDYSEHLERLDKLTESYYSFHNLED